MELKQLLEQLQKAFEEFKKANDARIDALEKKGTVDPTLVARVDKANADVDRLVKERDEKIAQLQREMDQIKTAMNRPGAPGSVAGDSEDEQKAFRRKSFAKYLRKGAERMTLEETKGLMSSSDPDGGYLVDNTVEAGILRTLATISAVRALANVTTLSTGDTLLKKRRTQGVTATRAGELSTNPAAQNPKLGMLRIQAHEMRVLLEETAQILEDASTDVEAWLQEEAAEAFANLEGYDVLLGDGVLGARGMLTYSHGTAVGQVEQVATGTAATIADADGQANGLISAQFKLKAAYAKEAKWLINRATVGSIRKLKDADKGYIWSPGLGTNPATILGHEYVEDDNMPVEGANNLVAVFGAFKKFYRIVDRLGISTIRDPFAAKPDVQFLTRKRMGGDVEIFEAAKIVKCAVSL